MELLVPPLYRNWSSREQALKALIQIGPPAVESLLTAFKGRDHYLRQGVARALVQIGDVRVVMPLIRLAANKEVASDVIETLERILRDNATNAAEEDLRAVVSLANVVQIYQLDVSCTNPIRTTEHTVHCSQVKQLARQELIRRGLDA